VHTIDAKNRMSLPATFRQQLQQRGPGDEAPKPPIITNANFCLELYPFDDWVKFEEDIVSIASVDPEAQAYARVMISGAPSAPSTSRAASWCRRTCASTRASSAK